MRCSISNPVKPCFNWMSLTLLEWHLNRRGFVSLFYGLNSHVCPTYISFSHLLTFFPEVFLICDSRGCSFKWSIIFFHLSLQSPSVSFTLKRRYYPFISVVISHTRLITDNVNWFKIILLNNIVQPLFIMDSYFMCYFLKGNRKIFS